MLTEKQSFSKSHRLLTPADFQAVFSQPLRSRSTYFTILGRQSQQTGGQARLGIIVAKRLIKGAVQRNAIRRIIRESFRKNLSLLAGLDVVILVRCSLPDKPNSVFFDCLKQQWQELSVQFKTE